MFKLQEGWSTVLLMVALVVVAAWSIEASKWTAELWMASSSGAIGVLAGLALAKSRFKGVTATFFALVYGLFYVGLLTASTLRGTWHNRTLEIIVRVNNFLYYALHGGTSRDVLPFPMFVALVCWLAGVVGAWAIFRRGSIWPAIIPGGTAMLINAYYYMGDEPLDLFLAAYLVISLMLIARISLLGREREWRAAFVAYTPDTRFEFLRAGLVVAVVTVMAAWAGPSMAASPQAVTVWNRVNGSWAVVRENFERLFNAVRNPGINAQDFYGDSLILGTGSNLTARQIMDVVVGPVVDERDPESRRLEPIPRLYWRALTYQLYTDHWESGDAVEFREYDPERGGLSMTGYRFRQDVSATFRMLVDGTSRLYVLPQPYSVDRAVTFGGLMTPGNALDPVSVRAQEVLGGDDRQYQVIASVSVADIDSLREAGRDYPEWVTAYYLQLPPSITQRTRELARQIVAEAEATTPFDQAQAITNWLRDNITYQLGIEPPPGGVEPIDWFLFDTRTGFCNYYASAAVVLMRSLGIPARMAVGFAQGQLEGGVYHVRELDLHAWPEAFFPNYGWIEFEPTSAQPELVRPERQEAAPLSTQSAPRPAPTPDLGLDERDNEPENQANPAGSTWAGLLGRWGQTLVIALGVLALAGLGGAIGLMRAGLIGLENFGRVGRRLLRWMGQAVPSLVTQAYIQLERAARWLRLNLPESYTPVERAESLSRALPDVRPAIQTITEQYTLEQYGPPDAAPDVAAAQGAWRSMQGRVWSNGLRVTWQGLKEFDPIHAVRRWLLRGRPL